MATKFINTKKDNLNLIKGTTMVKLSDIGRRINSVVHFREVKQTAEVVADSSCKTASKKTFSGFKSNLRRSNVQLLGIHFAHISQRKPASEIDNPNDLIDKVIALLPRTVEEKDKIFKQIKNIAQDRKLQDSRELSVDRLALLPRALREQLAELKTQNIETPIIKALWKTLESNTEHLAEKWCFVPHNQESSLPQTSRIVSPRFSDIGLVESSAIAVSTCPPDVTTKYLHANRMNFGCGKYFIASQMPMQNEIPGFSKMLATERVALIVDLTRPEEKDRAAIYAPSSQNTLQTGSVTKISCTKSTWLNHPKANLKQLCIDSDSQKINVKRLHFKAWPDHGVVDHRTLIQLADQVERLSPDLSRPVLIHCRAGVGRTGSLMAFIAARRKLLSISDDKGNCTPENVIKTLLKVIAKGRIDRGPEFIQTEDQFKVVLEALMQTLAQGQSSRILIHAPPLSGELSVKPKPSTDFQPSINGAVLPDPELLSQANDESDHLPASEVGANSANVICPRKTALFVSVREEGKLRKKYIHANEIRFLSQSSISPDIHSSPPVDRVAVAAQSPQEFELCERFLTKSLDSNQGLFQFISPRAHRRPELCTDKPIIGQLRQRFKEAAHSGVPFLIAKRYRIDKIEDVSVDPNSRDHLCVKVTAEDLDNPGSVTSILITQAGLKFQDSILLSKEIERSHALMNSQMNSQTQIPEGSLSDPIVISYAGIGRSATLICYREALARLNEAKNENDVDDLLDQIVAQGRKDRGPRFIHSKSQFDELRSTVMKQFACLRTSE